MLIKIFGEVTKVGDFRKNVSNLQSIKLKTHEIKTIPFENCLKILKIPAYWLSHYLKIQQKLIFSRLQLF